METVNKQAISTQKWVLHADQQEDIILVGQLLVGRDPECDICIPDHRISRHHAKISVTESGVVVEDLGSANGTKINDQKISEPRLFQSGDKIKFHNMEFTAERLSVEKTDVLFLCSNDFEDIELKAQILVGRDAACEICIADHRISRMHAKITVGDKGPVVEDLNSINGTFVNGQKIKQPTQIVVGDRLRFHETEFRLEKLVDPDATIVCMNVVDPDATLFAGAIIKDTPIKTAEKNNPSVRAPIRESFEGQLKNDSTNNQEVKKLSAIQRQVNYGAKPQGNKISQLEVGMWVEFLGNRGKNEIYCLVSKGTSKDSSFSFMKQNGFKVVKKERKRIEFELSIKSFRILQKGPVLGAIPVFFKRAIMRTFDLSNSK